MGVTRSETLILDLDTHNALELVTEPVFQYGNVLDTQNGGLYKWKMGKDKHRFLHLNQPKNVLQSRKNCEDWKPTIRTGFRPYEITVCDFELMSELCWDDFDYGCLRNLKGWSDSEDEYDTDVIETMQAAIIMSIQKQISNDLAQISWFGDKYFTEKIASGESKYDLSCMTGQERSDFIDKIETCDGWWSEIYAKSQIEDTKDGNHIRYLDTNNGTVNGNAVTAANIERYLNMMIMRSSNELKSHRKGIGMYGMTAADLPCFLLQPGLYNALYEAYTDGDCCQARALKINGEEMPGMLTFRGYPVICMTDWDVWDASVGVGVDPYTGNSLCQRAIFTAKENLCGIANMQRLNGDFDSSLMVGKIPDIRAKGKVAIHGKFGFGFGIAHPKLMTVGYNSSVSYIQ